MPRIRTLQRAFTGGVISPSLWGHVEDTKFLTGAARMENMIPSPQGKLSMRPGTMFVNEVADSTKTSVIRTFGAGSTNGYTVGIEEGRFRFYIDGATLLWATPRLVATVDATANTVEFTAPHGFTADQQVRLVKPAGSTAPTGLSTTADLFVIVVDTTTIQLASTSLGSAIDISSTGSGDLWFYAASEMPDDYVTSKNASGVDAPNNELTVTSHGLSTGAPIELTVTLTFTADVTNFCTSVAHGLTNYMPVTVSSSGTLPGGLTEGVVYYASPYFGSPDYFFLADAPYGNVIDITSTGSGTHTMTLATGAVVLASTPALYVGTTYYARNSGANDILICPTEADAIAGTNIVDITGAGAGTTRVHYGYTQGDLVNYPNSGIYYCEVDSPQNSAPGSADWYMLPFTGEYQIPNPYVESNLLYLDRDQIGDTLTLAHPDHGLYGLVREDDLRWKLVRETLAAPLDTPTGVAVTAHRGENLECTFTNASPAVFTTATAHSFAAGVDTAYLTVLTGTVGSGTGNYIINTTPAGSTFTLKEQDGGEAVNSSSTGTALVQISSPVFDVDESYFVTALRADGAESDVSTEVQVTNNLYVPGAYNTVTWLSVEGVERYRVYKAKHGLAGLIGETYETTFVDDNVAPDMTFTPPRRSTIGLPGVVSSFEQRRVLSGVEATAQNVWFTELGTTGSLAFHIPVLDTDRIEFELASPLAAAVRSIVPMTNLVIFTESTEFVMTTVDSEALTPTSFRARPVSYIGCSIVKPLLVNDRTFFCANRGGHIYSFSLRAAFEGYKPDDVCLRAPHLFDGYTIVDSALQKSPFTCMWFVRSDGALLGYTFSAEEEVGGWHIHTTPNGAFERVCVAAEGDEDRVYFIVRRTIDGNTVRYVERFAPFAEVDDIADAFHVDSGIAYSGAAASSIAGYDHLEGEEVVANSSGTVSKGLTVSGGVVYTGVSSTQAVVGLPYEGLFQSLPAAANVDGAAAQGRQKGTGRAYIRVEASGLYRAGATDELVERVVGGEPGELATEETRLVLPGSWSEGGQIFIVQPNPLPLHIVSLTTDVDLGGG